MDTYDNVTLAADGRLVPTPPVADHKPLPTDTLMRALDKLRAGRWADLRSKDVLYSQGKEAVISLRSYMFAQGSVAPIAVADVTPSAVSAAIHEWQGKHLAPDTIRKRLNVLRAMGVDLGKAEDRPKLSKKRPLKWWLSPSDEERLVRRFQSAGGGQSLMMAHYIRFVTRSGLRVEEALALTPASLSFTVAAPSPREGASVTVRGTKTAGSHATLPLLPDAYDALVEAWRLEWTEALHTTDRRETRIFRFGKTPEVSYSIAASIWEGCRRFLGQQDNPTATLKALRRSAARYLHISKGMPLDMVREYLRHDDIETTQGYLRLTGGYGEADMRRFL